MTNALIDRKDNMTAKQIDEISYIEIELELDSETYEKLMYCQNKMNASTDDVIRHCIYTLKDSLPK